MHGMSMRGLERGTPNKLTPLVTPWQQSSETPPHCRPHTLASEDQLTSKHPSKDMSQQLRFIVDTLNQPPFSRKYNLVTFDSLDSFNLLQVLNDVLSEISPDHKIDLRGEPPDQTAIRIFSLLRVLKYKPKTDQGGGLNAFRQGLMQGDKPTIYPLLQWLLERLSELKKRAYLARFLGKIEVPSEFLQDEVMIEAKAIHDELLEQFKELHKTVQQQRSSQFNVAEVRKDIASMEEEKEQLIKRTERLKQKAASTPNHTEMLEAARQLRKEKDRELELANQKVEQKNQLLHAQQKTQRLQKQLEDMKSSSQDLTPKGLISKLGEENTLKRILTEESMPKKVEAKRKECIELEWVLAEPIMSELDLDTIRQEIEEANEEVARLMEKRMPGSDPIQDKLALFRQQASIIARKKEAAAEAYKTLTDELAAVEAELQSKRDQLREFDGGEVLREDEFKRFVNRLRTMNATYKKKKAELSTFKAEYGVLARTEEILKSRDENIEELVAVLEQEKGVQGYRETQDALEEVSTAKGEFDERKGAVLEEMARAIEQLTAAIESKKAFLAPLIKEVRPLRLRHQEVQAQHTEKKVAYDGLAAGYEGQRSNLEKEVKAYWEETTAEESRYHYLQYMLKSVKLQEQKVAAEMQCYVSSDPAEKRKSLRDQFTRKIQEQENLGKALRDKQKEVKETHGDTMKQVKMWKDLKRLFEVKHECFVQGQQQMLQAKAAEQKMMANENRLVIS